MRVGKIRMKRRDRIGWVICWMIRSRRMAVLLLEPIIVKELQQQIRKSRLIKALRFTR